jgi:hypothetical protein
MRTNSRTHNGANAFEHSENHLLEFFSKGASLYTKKGTYYGNEATAVELFKNAWRSDAEMSMKLAFWVRDCRGGGGNRSGFRAIIKWLAENNTEWLTANINLIPKYGRWDDLLSLYGTPCEDKALEIWSEAIISDNPSINGLACKWADRQDAKLRGYMKMSPKAFRKLVVSKTKVIETLMCEKKWDKIEFNHVPSVASARYKKAFLAHDAERYNAWRLSLTKEDSGNKVNASVLMPHDIIRMVRSDGRDANVNSLAEAQLKAMPNFMEGTNYRIMPICDFSGSMGTSVSGVITAMDVALSLGLYCSEKVGKDNPFYRKLIPFSNTSKIESWKNMTLVEAIRCIPNGYCGSTNIQSALDKILEAATLFNATNDQIPNVLLILSDMQFDQGGVADKDTPVNACLNRWKAAGYTIPKVIYWNLAGYGNQPATCKDREVALISGFSPSILKSVLGGGDFTPLGIMKTTLNNYEVVTP